ncbi:MAG: hypothetical protein ABH885_04505, partial [Candidatus Omnitrophota bacterium]
GPAARFYTRSFDRQADDGALDEILTMCAVTNPTTRNVAEREAIMLGFAHAILYYHGTEKEKRDIDEAFREYDAAQPKPDPANPGYVVVPEFPPINEAVMRELREITGASYESGYSWGELLKRNQKGKNIDLREFRAAWRLAAVELRRIADLDGKQEGILDRILLASAKVAAGYSKKVKVPVRWGRDIEGLRRSLRDLVVTAEQLAKGETIDKEGMAKAGYDCVTIALKLFFGVGNDIVNTRKDYGLPPAGMPESDAQPEPAGRAKIEDGLSTARGLGRRMAEIRALQADPMRLVGSPKKMRGFMDSVAGMCDGTARLIRLIMDMPVAEKERFLAMSMRVHDAYKANTERGLEANHRRVAWSGTDEELEEVLRTFAGWARKREQPDDVRCTAIGTYVKDALFLLYGTNEERACTAIFIGLDPAEFTGRPGEGAAEDDAVKDAFLEEDYSAMREYTCEQIRAKLKAADRKDVCAMWTRQEDGRFVLAKARLYEELGFVMEHSPGVKLARYMRQLKDRVVKFDLAEPYNEDKTPWGIRITYTADGQDGVRTTGIADIVKQHKAVTDVIVYIRKPGEQGKGWARDAFLTKDDLSAYAVSGNYDALCDLAWDERLLVSDMFYLLPDRKAAEAFTHILGGNEGDRAVYLRALLSNSLLSTHAAVKATEYRGRETAAAMVEAFRSGAAKIDSIEDLDAMREKTLDAMVSSKNGDKYVRKLDYSEEYVLMVEAVYKMNLARIKAVEERESRLRDEERRRNREAALRVADVFGSETPATLDEFREAYRR